MTDSLRDAVLDGILDGFLGKGLIVTRMEVCASYPHYAETYTLSFLSNSEMDTGTHSPTYEKFTQRIAEGVYRIHPEALATRFRERGQKGSVTTNRLVWDQASLSRLDLIFLRTVLDNMREASSKVRFGVTGQGIKPNYQITFKNGLVRPLSGLSHELHEKGKFDSENLSETEFSYDDIAAAYNAKRPK
jgi:hypothetical protein